MGNNLELKVVFSAVDKFLRPANAITKAAKEASQALKLNEDRIRDFNSTVAKIDAFKKVERDAAITANSVKSTAAKIAELRAEIAKTGAPTEAQSRKLDELKAKSEALDLTTDKLRRHEIDLGAALKTAGIDTKSLAAAREHLVAASSSELMMSKKLQAALDAENKKMQRLKTAQADLTKSRETAGKLAGKGAGLMAGGAAVGLPVAITTKAYADFETAMLGVARQVDDARDANGRYTATYFEMGDAIKAMSEKLPMTANEIAKIVEAGARMGIQGKANLLTFTETTAVMASAFDLPVDQVGEDIGKISQLYKVPIKDIKALGDTINFLDDNALAKGGDIIDVMKRIAGTADMVKMNFREAAALGSTFLSLGAMPEVAASASNAMIRELSIATMQSKRFLGGLDMLKLKAGDVQLGMNKDATGTILKVLEAIKQLPEQKQLEAATRLFGKEFGDDAAKLASNMDEYRRQLELVNDEKAKGSMQRESDTRNASVNSRMNMAKNALTNIASDLGETLRPALVETLERTLAVAQGVRAWAKENPQLASGLMIVVKYLALGLTAIGGIALAAAGILGPLAMAKFAMTTLGLSAGGLAGGALNILMKGIGGVGTAMMWVSRIFLMNPIGLTITAIALLVYRYWEPIKAFFIGFWDGLSTVAGPALQRLWNALKGVLSSAADLLSLIPGWGSVIGPAFDLIAGGVKDLFSWLGRLMEPVDKTTESARNMGQAFGAAVGNIVALFAGLPTIMLETGKQIIDGLIGGLRSRWEALKETVTGVANALPEWMRKPLDVHSPSRVFAQIGSYTMQGLEQGITSGEDGPLSAVGAMAKKLAGIGAGIAIGGSAMAGEIPLDTRPPINPAAAMSALAREAGGNAASTASAPMQVTIHIYGAPGQGTGDIQRQVEQALANVEAKRAAQQRSRLRDSE